MVVTAGKNLIDFAKEFQSDPVLPDRSKGHPRVFGTKSDIDVLKGRIHGPLKRDWLEVQAQAVEQGGREPEGVANALCGKVLSYLVTEEEFYLDLIREHIRRVLMLSKTGTEAPIPEKMELTAWGGDPYEPGQGRTLVSGHSLMALAFAYDFLFSHLTSEEIDFLRRQLAYNCRLLYEYYTKEPRVWRYAQNHPYTPMAGVAVAAYALYGEEPEAEEWLRLSEAFLQRTLQCVGTDGWYYEGWDYWRGCVTTLAVYAEAHYQMTGRKNVLSSPILRNIPTYARHMLLPGGHEYFDFGDCHSMYIPWHQTYRLDIREDPEYYYKVATWREKQTLLGGKLEYETEPKGVVPVPVHLVELIAARFEDSQAQELAEYVGMRGQKGRGASWSLLWRDPDLQPTSTRDLPNGHYFDDHEVATWRSTWDARGTAVAVKCGPPIGHRNAVNMREIPDLDIGAGHAHPDAGSFILFSHGQWLCTDTGYCLPSVSANHNTLLINGRGQESAGGYDGFRSIPYDQLNKVRLTRTDIQREFLFAEADMTHAYPPDLEMDRILRRFLVMENCMLVWDILESEYPHDFAWLLNTDTVYDQVNGLWETRNGDVALQAHFLHPAPADMEVEVQQVVVIPHAHFPPTASGPAHQRGHHLIARQRGSHCQYATCLTWGWRYAGVPKVEGSLNGDHLEVNLEWKDRRMSLKLYETGVEVS